MYKTAQKYIIAIDGGAATGKSTIAKAVAKELNYIYIDSGSMYRAATLYFIENNIEPTVENILANLDNIHISFKLEGTCIYTLLNGVDVTELLHSAKVSSIVPTVSKVKELRKRMVTLQREFSNNNNIVMDGRDITSVVFPDATFKVYLTASLDERARRRKVDLEKRGEFLDIEVVKQDIVNRDKIDMEREESPLIKVDDAITLDTTGNTIEENVSTLIELFKKRIEI